MADIPAAMLALHQRAAATCRGLSWTVLAAIGTVESDNGQSTLHGVDSGAVSDSCAGPLVVPTWGGKSLGLLGSRAGEVGITRRFGGRR